MNSPIVSVIIRTQCRPLFLQRALSSLKAQTLTDWEAIIVNDGGPELSSTLFNDRIRVVQHQHALGRSPAANRGLKEATGKYAAFLDDDDTWEPTFLSETVSRLEAGGMAVATHASKVIESLVDDRIVTKKKVLHRPVKNSVGLFDLAVSNFLPIHSCVFNREIALQIGGIDESLPLLEDWDFFLRLGERCEIGMITKPLANYHMREKSSAGDNQNTVVQNRPLCIFCENYIRNKYLRRDLCAGKFGLGMMLNMAQATRDLSFWRCLKNDLTFMKNKLFS